MDLVSSILGMVMGLVLLFAMVGIPAVFVVGIVWLVRRNQKRQDLFAASAGTLGLTPEGRQCLVGLRGGVHVRVRHVQEGSGDNRRLLTYVEASIDPPLRLGARIRSQGWVGAAFSELLGKATRVGDPAFDRDFSVDAVEADELLRLLDPELRRALAEVRARFASLWIDDDEVLIKMSGWVVDVRRLDNALDATVHLCLRTMASRRAMGPTERERAVIESWTRVAAERGWAFDSAQLSLEGPIDRARFQVVPMLGASGWATRFRVNFDRPLGVDLQLKREGAFTAVGRFFGVQDIHIGDPRFDGAFVIKGSNPDGVRHVLGDEALREQLLALLGAAKALHVSDNHVEGVAHGLVDDAARLHHSLELVASVARGLRARVDAPAAGAYR